MSRSKRIATKVKRHYVAIIVLILAILLFFYISHLWLSSFNPPLDIPCPERYSISSELNIDIQNANQAYINLKSALENSTHWYIRESGKSLTSDSLIFRNITYGDQQVSAWVYRNEWAIDKEGSIYGRLYCL